MPRKKHSYRYVVKNYRTYNEALVQRGSPTMWMPADWLSRWEAPQERKRGAPFRYSDATILMIQTLCTVFRLPYRATEGLMRSILELMRVSRRVPDYTTPCRRGRRLRVEIHDTAEQGRRGSGGDFAWNRGSGWMIPEHGGIAAVVEGLGRLGVQLQRKVVFIRERNFRFVGSVGSGSTSGGKDSLIIELCFPTIPMFRATQ